MSNSKVDALCIQALRTIAVEEIDAAASGHPGIALGAAPIIHTLYSRILKVYPKEENWFNRDRFILAAGHGSSLLYAMLSLFGYKINEMDLGNFRQYGSITPGHPELDVTPGVDATSGPLGQGIPEGVGFAIAESFLAAKYNRSDATIVDHFTYVLCGDGDLQEGVTNEALSLAGHLGLGKLIVLYDSNDIQLDGPVNLANSENVKMKFQSMNWDYQYVEDGESVEAIEKAVLKAQKVSDKPSIICIHTIIGKTAQDQGTSSIHGKPLSSDEVKEFRARLGNNTFTAPREVYEHYRDVVNKNYEKYERWFNYCSLYELRHEQDYQEFLSVLKNDKKIVLKGLLNYDKNFLQSTRKASGEFISLISEILPTFIGGSADLTGSTFAKGADGAFSKDNRLGRNIYFGVREHAMAAICNGIALHGGLKVFCGGFFVFCDYMKPAIRLASLMKLPITYVFTHDSIAVGEDGPTHQPIEQITMLRSIPNLNVIRPADVNEVCEAYEIALNSQKTPTALVLTRQNVPTLTIHGGTGNLVKCGAYVISPERGTLDGIILASGSELALALEVQKALEHEGKYTRVVSIPCTSLFDSQPLAYKQELLPNNIRKRLAIEMSDATHLYKYVGLDGKVLNITTFGTSGKAKMVINEYGFNLYNALELYHSMK